MYARWGSFAIGLGLVLAPLLAGYRDAGAILHDIALGLLVCVIALAALETPSLRFLLLAPAGWLLWTGARAGDPAVARAELLAGALVAVTALLPRGRVKGLHPLVLRRPRHDRTRSAAAHPEPVEG